MKKALNLLVVFLISFNSYATNLVAVKPVSDKVVELVFIDGTINHHNLGMSRDMDSVTLFPGGRLAVADAQVVTNYRIASTNDFNYTTFKNPVRVGVNKRIEQTWTGDWEGRPTHVEEIHVYLFLSQALQANKQYSFNVVASSFNTLKNSLSFVFDTKQLLSNSIHVNNLGYVPTAPNKFAYVYNWLGDQEYLKMQNDSFITQPPIGINRKFFIRSQINNAIVFTGDVVFRKPFDQIEFGQWGTNNNNFSGADVYECDFSSFNDPGSYYIEVEKIGRSHTFDISPTIYYEPLFYGLKSLYENRSGIALNKPYAQYNRPIPHKPGVNGFNLFYSKKSHYDLGPQSTDANAADTSSIDSFITGPVNVWGWYQDAGDWDAYHTHSKVPAYLLHLYESNTPVFDTMKLNLEFESVNNFPDVLDEARWLIRFYKRCKDSIQTSLHGGTGGVPGGRIFGDIYPTNNNTDAENGGGSWQDVNRKWVMLGESVHLTYIYAGLCAHLASIINANSLTDPEGINWQTEALQAWNWAQSNTKSLDIVPNQDYNLAHFRIYAAASLYKLTAQKSPYENSFKFDLDHIPDDNTNVKYIGQSWYTPYDTISPQWTSIPTTFISNEDFLSMAAINYYKGAMANMNADIATQQRIKDIIIDASNFLLSSNNFTNTMQNRACRWGGNWWLPMGIGQNTTPYLNIAAMAIPQLKNTQDSTTVKDWVGNMYTTADYFLGTNPLNMTMMSGLGEKSIPQIFHIDSWYCNNGVDSNLKKGFVSYGPMNFQGSDLGGFGGFPAPYQYYYGLNKSYPAPIDRPGHERFMASRTSPLANENTIHQTSIQSVLTYGTLFSLTALNPNAPLQSSPNTPPVKNAPQQTGIVFPNPTNDFFNLKLEYPITELNIYSIEGRAVISLPINPQNKYDISTLPSGLYMIAAQLANKTIKYFKINKK